MSTLSGCWMDATVRKKSNGKWIFKEEVELVIRRRRRGFEIEENGKHISLAQQLFQSFRIMGTEKQIKKRQCCGLVEQQPPGDKQ